MISFCYGRTIDIVMDVMIDMFDISHVNLHCYNLIEINMYKTL